MGTELFHADKQTDRPKLIVAFRNFATVLKKRVLCNTHVIL